MDDPSEQPPLPPPQGVEVATAPWKCWRLATGADVAIVIPGFDDPPAGFDHQPE